MKKFYFLLIVFNCCCSSFSQIITFTDLNFKAKLVLASPTNTIAQNLTGNYFKIDANNNGEIEVTEALQVSFLSVPNSNISSLTQLSFFPNLIYINCNYNFISTLNLSGLPALEFILCSDNLLTSLNVNSLANLDYLDFKNNQITSINLTDNINLRYLSCYSNNLTSLNINHIPTMEQLYCYSNQLTSLNVLGLENLWLLYCSGNLLTSLNITGVPINQFSCSNNLLTSLDLSTNNIGEFYCSNNLLTSLNVSNMTNLSTFYCSNNQLTTLDVSANNLANFNCSNNLISTINLNGMLPPVGCYEGCAATINVSNNNLVSFFIKSGRTSMNLNFSGNPSLQYICTNDSQIPAIQAKINTYGYTNCHVNSYCSFNPGGVFYTINGNNKFDANSNGCDTSDINASFLKCSITKNSVSTTVFSDNSGNYSLGVQNGTYTITPILENASYFSIAPTSSEVTFPNSLTTYTQDFCISPNGMHNDLEISIVPLNISIPGFNCNYKILYKNKGNTLLSGDLQFTFNDAIFDYVSSSLVPNILALNNLTWNYSNLYPFETRQIFVTLNLNSPMESPSVNNGDILNFDIVINPNTSDDTPNDNQFSLVQAVLNSLDPNDKTCLEGPTITPAKVGDYVHYIIRFENTGTANAQNIVVKDMIDTTKFDITSLIPLDASHSFTTRIINTNQVEFIFQNIQLPFDNANNDGYVVFKIKTKPTLVLGNTFSNTANIYFDYNFPIITNTYTATVAALANQDFEFSNYLSLYPNPAKQTLNIQSKESIEVRSISIYNVLGQLMMVIPNAKGTDSIDVSSLTTGNYFIKIVSDRGASNSKFIKE